MRGFAAGARRLPLHHVTIRVPWHDGGWTGTVCARPLDNSSCLILPRIGEGRCFIRELLLTFSLSSTTCDSAWVSRGFSVIKHV